MNLRNYITVFIFLMLVSSCKMQKAYNVLKNKEETKSEEETIVKNVQEKTFKGWWVYGEDQHLFKDEETLEEYDLIFLNENMEDLKLLYLAICETEYFPMECNMTGHIKKDILEKKSALMVSEFEILYVEGCDD